VALREAEWMREMIITFLVPTKAHPLGGATALWEFANGMRRRGHSVHVVHIGIGGDRIESLDDMPWTSFEDGIQHAFPDKQEPYELPEADFIAANYERYPRPHGLPIMFVQGYRMFPTQLEERVFRAPFPKICIARWLVDVGKRMGVPAHQLVHVPYGLRHEKYRLVSPIENRPPLVSMLYRNHPMKGPAQGLEALAEVKKRVPEVEAVVFSPGPPDQQIPPWMTFVKDPPQVVIVNEIYNRSRVFLCSSVLEGFGFSAIEAMAGGAALVTTSNGGSDDYAIHGETALVCKPNDIAAMAEHIARLLRDDEQRIRLAKQAGEYVRETFDWDVSAEKLETFLNAYGADPDRYLQQPAESH
jgi:glycosyltransferase involved in cell wall biosynthesis